MRAMRWRGWTTPICACSSRRRRPNRVPREPRSCKRKRKSGASTTLAKQGWTANADFDKARAAAEQARAAASAPTARSRSRATPSTTRRSPPTPTASSARSRPRRAKSSRPARRLFALRISDEQEAAVSVPETLVERARVAPARVEFWALPGVSVGGEAARTLANADPATRTYPARFTPRRRAGERRASA